MITSAVMSRRKQTVFGLMCIFCLCLILKNSQTAVEYMQTGMKLCTGVVIPSLFPFMVVSGILVRIGIGGKVSKIIGRLSSALFGVSADGGSAVFLGLLCGSPIGAQMTASLLDRGAINKKEAERLLIISSAPSSAFVINAVGISLFSSKMSGVIFYFVTLSSICLIGIIHRVLFGKVAEKESTREVRRALGVNIFTDSISSAAISMLYVCAYVVFFSVLIGCIGSISVKISTVKRLLPFIYGILEMSGGIGASAAIANRLTGICLTAFILGWSGFSVHLQIISVCSERGLSFGRYFVSRMCVGIINALTVLFIYLSSPHLFSQTASDIFVPAISPLHSHIGLYISAFLLSIPTVCLIFRRIKR